MAWSTSASIYIAVHFGGAQSRVSLASLAAALSAAAAVTISGDQATVIANAWQMQPHWNGKEVTLDGGLPLGIFTDAQFTRP